MTHHMRRPSAGRAAWQRLIWLDTKYDRRVALAILGSLMLVGWRLVE